MNIYFATTADLYREIRRTQSRRKRLKIAAELQRRHDELNGGEDTWFCTLWVEKVPIYGFGGRILGEREEPVGYHYRRYDFTLLC